MISCPRWIQDDPAPVQNMRRLWSLGRADPPEGRAANEDSGPLGRADPHEGGAANEDSGPVGRADPPEGRAANEDSGPLGRADPPEGRAAYAPPVGPERRAAIMGGIIV